MVFPNKPDEDWYWPVEILYTLVFFMLFDLSFYLFRLITILFFDPTLIVHGFSVVFQALDYIVLLHKEFEILTLHSIFLEKLKFVFLSEVAHRSFCAKFNGLIIELRITEKSYATSLMTRT